MSLGTRITAAVAVLGICLAALLGIDAVSAWRQVSEAQRQLRLNAVSAELIRAAGALAAERGLVNGMLADPAKAPADARAAVLQQREAADAALSSPLAAGLAEDTDQVTRARSALNDLRGKVDRAFAGTPDAGPPALAWFATATDAIDAVVALRRAVDAAGGQESPVVRLAALRDRLAEMSEFAGRQRGMVNGLISAGAKASPAQVSAIGAMSGRIDGAWARVSPRLQGASHAVLTAVHAAQDAWFKDFGPTRDAVLLAAAQGAPWPLSANDWFARATTAINALIAAQAQAGEDVEAALARERSHLNNILLGTAALLAMAAAVGGVILWYVRRGVAGPLQRAITAVDLLAAGNLDVEIPAHRAHDEIGRLLLAMAHFRDTARHARALATEQAKLRAEADSARTLAIREIGDMIEDVSERAIEGVRATAEQLRGLSDQLDHGARAIASDTGEAATAAAEGMRGADAAAGGARELASSIHEIAAQMERSAAATRGAVERVNEAQRVLAMLSASVGEIGEVAGLISEIAGRTNLLALNATIEAARAGEAGRGFAVVAGEVKALAQETRRSTERISERIGAIDAACRQAVGAISGITATVGELDGIASSVASAIEQQSSATAAIAEAVDRSSQAANRVAERVDAAASATGQCEQAAAGTATVSRDVAKGVNELKSTLVRLMRTRVEELDRRQERRFAVTLQGELRAGAQVWPGEVIDVSASGLRFVPNVAIAIGAGDTAALSCAGLPPATIRVVS